MVLRTTTMATNNSLLNYIWTNQAKYNETSEHIATQKKLNRPSDNATDAISVLNVNKEINQLNGYLNNMELGGNELNVVDNTLSSVVSDLQRANDLCVTSSNGTMSETNLNNIKTEIDQIIANIMDLSNTQFNGSFIFSGTNTGTTTYTQDANGSIVYAGTPEDEDYQRYIQIADGVKTAINVPGDEVFGSYDATDDTKGSGIFKVLSDFSNSLSQSPPDYTAISANLDKIQGCINETSNVRTQLASITQRFEMTGNSINTNLLQLKSYKSNLEDVDLAAAATDLSAQGYALQATMAVASNLMRGASLLNYL